MTGSEKLVIDITGLEAPKLYLLIISLIDKVTRIYRGNRPGSLRSTFHFIFLLF